MTFSVADFTFASRINWESGFGSGIIQICNFFHVLKMLLKLMLTDAPILHVIKWYGKFKEFNNNLRTIFVYILHCIIVPTMTKT